MFNLILSTMSIFTACLAFFVTEAFSQTVPDSVHALVVYACDADDHYRFPQQGMRDSLYSRISSFYKTMSYGKHILSFEEVHDNGRYFVSDHPADYYRNHYDRKRHVRGFGMFNEEILNKVKARHGDAVFQSVDIVIVVGTDAGPDWYVRRANATGFGMLGCDFAGGGKLFKRGQRQGGLTFEMGSDVGTSNPDDDILLKLADIHWTMAHEYGHWLGLGHRSNNLGIYSLMTLRRQAVKGTPQFGPAPLDPFHIMTLGWLNEDDSSRVLAFSVDSMDKQVVLKQLRSLTGHVLARVDLPNQREHIYFSFHRHNDNAFDNVYLDQGLLIWQKKGVRLKLLRRLDETADHQLIHTRQGKLEVSKIRVLNDKIVFRVRQISR